MDGKKAAAKLKGFKKKSGWTFRRIAEEMSVPQVTVTAWIQGWRTPNQYAARFIQTFLEERGIK